MTGQGGCNKMGGGGGKVLKIRVNMSQNKELYYGGGKINSKT